MCHVKCEMRICFLVETNFIKIHMRIIIAYKTQKTQVLTIVYTMKCMFNGKMCPRFTVKMLGIISCIHCHLSHKRHKSPYMQNIDTL